METDVEQHRREKEKSCVPIVFSFPANAKYNFILYKPNPTYAIELKALLFFRRSNASGKVHEDEVNKKKSILIAFARFVLPHLALILTRLHRVNKKKTICVETVFSRYHECKRTTK